MQPHLNEGLGGMAQEGQVEEDVVQHGSPPGGARLLQGALPPLQRSAACRAGLRAAHGAGRGVAYKWGRAQHMGQG